MVFSFRLSNLLKCHSIKKTKKVNRQMTGFFIYQIICCKIYQQGVFSHKDKGRQMIKEVIWLACMKCYTTHRIRGQEEIFSQRLVETVKVFAFLWRKELSMINLKTPAQPQHHGFSGGRVVMGDVCCDSCWLSVNVLTVY